MFLWEVRYMKKKTIAALLIGTIVTTSLCGCGIKIAMSPNRSGKMHHKVIIIDDETVITGSYNYSKNAENSNDENILIIKNAKIASRYFKEFKRCWRGTKGYM